MESKSNEKLIPSVLLVKASVQKITQHKITPYNCSRANVVFLQKCKYAITQNVRFVINVPQKPCEIYNNTWSNANEYYSFANQEPAILGNSLLIKFYYYYINICLIVNKPGLFLRISCHSIAHRYLFLTPDNRYF